MLEFRFCSCVSGLVDLGLGSWFGKLEVSLTSRVWIDWIMIWEVCTMQVCGWWFDVVRVFMARGCGCLVFVLRGFHVLVAGSSRLGTGLGGWI